MNALANIPIAISPEADAYVSELGIHDSLERLIEHARATIPGLLRLDVVLAPPYDTGNEITVLIEALRDTEAYQTDDPVRRSWREWRMATFPNEVNRHFVLLTSYGNNHAR